MVERERSPVELHAKRQCFVLKAIDEGAHEGMSEKTVNIGAAYVFGDSSLEEIAGSYDETRANASLHYVTLLKDSSEIHPKKLALLILLRICW